MLSLCFLGDATAFAWDPVHIEISVGGVLGNDERLWVNCDHKVEYFFVHLLI